MNVSCFGAPEIVLVLGNGAGHDAHMEPGRGQGVGAEQADGRGHQGGEGT